MTLAENLTRLRKQKQFSQPELADKAGVSKGYVYMLEAGDMANPSLDKLLKISEALNCTIADLVGESKTAARVDIQLEIPEALREFARRRKREGDPLADDELRSLAHMQYRGRRPQTLEDWAYVYEFLKRTFDKRK
ncbi:MAG: helix-turn-helix transcriptional regulator [Blastocatellia bacterium]|nr:helix-turn-helix transcriptional regulator [Blastocatellia bacterium]